MPVLSWSNFTGGEISPLLFGRIDIDLYKRGCKKMKNIMPLTHGPAIRRSGFRFMAKCYEVPNKPDAKVRLYPFFRSNGISMVLEIGDRYFRMVTEDGLIKHKSGKIIYITGIYDESDIKKLYFAQLDNRIFIAHPKYPLRVLKDFGSLWGFQSFFFHSSCWSIELRKCELILPPRVSSRKPLVRKVKYVIGGVDKYNRLSELQHMSMELLVPAEYNHENYVQLSWYPDSNAKLYNIYIVLNDIPVYVASTVNTHYQDMGLLPLNYSKAAPKILSEFLEPDHYPAKVAFYDQRLILASTNSEPSAVWGSVPGYYNNFESESVPNDNSAWKFQLASGNFNQILWLQSASKLLIGTANSEWRMSGYNGGTITANSVEVRQETAWGSTELRPLTVGQEILFIDRFGKNIRTFEYATTSGGYKSNSLNIYAEHLTRNRSIIDWDYSSVPHSIVWMVTDDGKLLGMTYSQTHQVIAWHLHETDGDFESVAVTRGINRDLVFVVVKRNINGKDTRYIEMLEEDFNPKDDNSLKDAFHLDSGITYKGEPTNQIKVEHLIGKYVDILADGNIIQNKLVPQDGIITLDKLASTIHIGLPYESTLETLPIDTDISDGTVQSRIKRISEISVRVENSSNMLIGSNEESLSEIKFYDHDNDNSNINSTKLFSGDKKIININGYDLNGSIIIKQNKPLPITITAIFPRIQNVGR